jgi:Mg2+ transporter MgtE
VEYLTSVVGRPVVDAQGEEMGHLSDLAIATGEIFPSVTALAFMGPEKRPLLLSWRKYVASFDDDAVRLRADREDLRFSYLQKDEILLVRDLMDKQIVDTQGIKVVRVNDLKLAEGKSDLRLLGADVGLRGLLRRLGLERAFDLVTKPFGYQLPENLIAWNYTELLEKDLSAVKLSVTHRRLHELHPADIADILEQLSSAQRSKVFEHLDAERAADAISEAEPDVQAELVESLGNERASDLLEEMDPDDAADILGDLPYEKAEALLNLMGVAEARDVRKLLGYREKSAGGIMTTDFVTVPEGHTVGQTIEQLRATADEPVVAHYVYVTDENGFLQGVLSLRRLIVASPDTPVIDVAETSLITVGPDDDQEEVASVIRKYDLLAVPVVDESTTLLGIVTFDDVLEVLEEESAEDMSLLTGTGEPLAATASSLSWFVRRSAWFTVWLFAGVVGSYILHAFGKLPSFSPALVLFIPLVLKLSDDVSARAIAVLIERAGEDEEEKRLAWRRVARDIGAGLLIAGVAGLVALALAALWGTPLTFALVAGVATFAAILAVTLIGTFTPAVLWLLPSEAASGFGPFISSFIAAAGLALYLAVATLGAGAVTS